MADNIRVAGQREAKLAANRPAGQDMLVGCQGLHFKEIVPGEVLVEGVEHPGAALGR